MPKIDARIGRGPMQAGLGGPPELVEQQADLIVTTTPPTTATPYALLASTRNVRIIGVAVKVVWTVQPSPLEVHIEIDGVTFTFSKVDPVSNTFYFTRQHDMSNTEAGQVLSATAEMYYPFLMEGRSVVISTETTGGTVSSMVARLRYAKIP